ISAHATLDDPSHAPHVSDEPAQAHGAHGHGAHTSHMHDAPRAMAIALVVLAIGSVVAGYVGVPNVVMHGGNRIEAFLEPSFRAPEAEAQAATEPAGEEASAATELGLMAVSTIAGLAGIGVATMIWLRRPETADRFATRFGGLYKLLLGKY